METDALDKRERYLRHAVGHEGGNIVQQRLPPYVIPAKARISRNRCIPTPLAKLPLPAFAGTAVGEVMGGMGVLESRATDLASRV